MQELANTNTPDEKTYAFANLSVLAALRLKSGIPFHVQMANNPGATREDVISAILVGFPPVGHVVTQSLPGAIEAYDSE